MPAASTVGVGVVIGAVLSRGADRAFRNTHQHSVQLGDSIKRTQARANRLRQTQGRLKRAIDVSSDSTGRLTTSFARLGRAIERAERRVKGYRKGLRDTQRIERAQAAWGRAYKPIGAAIGGAYAAQRLVAAAHEREDAAVRLRTVLVTDDVEADLAAGLAHAREAVRAGASLHSEAELLEIQYGLNSGGIDAASARVGSLVTSNVATVTRGAVGDVSEVMTTVLNTLGDTLEGDTGEKLVQIGDILTKTQFKYAIKDFPQLGEGMSAAAAAIAKVPLTQTAAAIGLLNSAGRALKVIAKVAGALLGVVSIKFILIGAAIAGAVALIYKYWEPIKGFFGNLWDGIVAKFWKVVDGVKAIFTGGVD